MFPNVFSSQITYQTFQKEMPFQMLESESLGCRSIQIFQLSPNFSLRTGTLQGCESFVQRQLLSEAQGWLEAGSSRALPMAWLLWPGWCWLLLQSPAPAGPTPATQAVSHAMQQVCVSEVLTQSHTYTSSIQQLCVSRDSWRYLCSSMVLFCSSLLLTTSTLLKRRVLPPVPFSHDPDIHLVHRQALLCSLLMQPATV